MHESDVASILDATASAILLVDEWGVIQYCNRAVEDIFGVASDKFTHAHINKLLSANTCQIPPNHFGQFFEKPFAQLMGEAASFPAQDPSAKTISITIAQSSILYKGEPCLVVTISEAAISEAAISEAAITEAQKPGVETTSIKRIKRNLAMRIEENKRLLRVVENSTDAVFLLSQDGKIRWVNQTAMSLLEGRSKDFLHKQITQFLSSDKNSKEKAELATALANGSSFTGEVALQTAVDALVLIDCSVLPVFEVEALQGYVFTARDVTSRRKLEAQMRENSELLETTARIAQLGFYSLDIATNELVWSEEVYNIHDLPINTKIEVQNAINYYAPEARSIISEAVDRCMRTGESFDLELPFITAKARKIWVRSVGYVEFKQGVPIKLKGAFQNITRLRQAAIDAEQAAQAKSNFLANMSHELRTPISGVLGLSEILAGTQLDEKQKQYVTAINQSGSTLLFLVNQVLDYAKLDSGSQKLKKRVFSLRQFIHEATYIHSVSANEKNCDFEVCIDDAMPEALYCDSERLRQVVNNLCGNAVKFTESGKISVEVKRNQDDEIVISIKDTGIGIKETDLDLLFKEFHQVDDSYSRTHQGTGLGLTISKQIIALLNGKVGVNSVYGEGSEFWFSFPLALIQSNVDLADSLVIIPNTLLLVTDEITANFWTELALQHKTKLRACTGMPELLSALKSDKNWDAVGLLDIGEDMPVATCVASIKRLLTAQQDFFLSQPLMQQAIQMDVDLDKVMQIDINTGAKSTNTSPVLEQFSTVVKWHKLKQLPSLDDWTGKRILIAEDNEINQLLFKEMLLDTSAELVIVENGQEAVAILEQDDEFDLIIMDCQMPVMDGFQATQHIRQHANTKIANIRISAATAHGFEEDIQRCYDVGMNDVMIKPFSRTTLIAVISRNL